MVSPARCVIWGKPPKAQNFLQFLVATTCPILEDLFSLPLDSLDAPNAWFDGDIFEHARMALKTRFAAMSLPDNPTHIETTPDAAINVPKPVLIPLHGWDRLASYMPKLLVQLLLCRMCLSYHTAFWVYVLGWVPAMYLASYDYHTLAAIWLAPIVASSTAFNKLPA